MHNSNDMLPMWIYNIGANTCIYIAITVVETK